MEERRWLCQTGQGDYIMTISTDNEVDIKFLSEPAVRSHEHGKINIEWDNRFMSGTLHFYDMVDKFDNDRPIKLNPIKFVKEVGVFVHFSDWARVVCGTRYILDNKGFFGMASVDCICVYYDLNDIIQRISMYDPKKIESEAIHEKNHNRRNSVGDIEYTVYINREINSWYWKAMFKIEDEKELNISQQDTET